MDNLKVLNDVLPDWLNNGFFSALQTFPVPWKSENIELSLNAEYHGNISGDKIISPLVDKILSGDALTNAEITILATTTIALYVINWEKQWLTMSQEYNPIENYSMTEILTDDKTVDDYGKTHKITNDLTHSKTGTETQTPDITETQTPNLTNNTNNAVYGFNSADAVPLETQSQSATGTNTNTQSGTDTTEFDISEKDTGSRTENDGGTDTRTRNYKLTRSGNIGVTTSQQMLQSERDLWLWNYFHNVVFPDVDKILTIQIY